MESNLFKGQFGSLRHANKCDITRKTGKKTGSGTFVLYSHDALGSGDFFGKILCYFSPKQKNLNQAAPQTHH